jgi:hypothetical protein
MSYLAIILDDFFSIHSKKYLHCEKSGCSWVKKENVIFRGGELGVIASLGVRPFCWKFG